MLKATIVQSVQPLFWDLLKQSREVVITSAYVDDHMVQTLLNEIANTNHVNLQSVDVILGVTAKTNPEALRLLLAATARTGSILRARVVAHLPGSLFQPKLYCFVTRTSMHILIGSGNFTAAGLSRNHEVFCYLECPPQHDLALKVRAILDHWRSATFSKPLAGDIVRRAAEMSGQLKEYIEHLKSVQNLPADMRETASEFAALLAGTAIFADLPDRLLGSQSVRLSALRAKLNEGIVVSCEVSVSKLRVNIEPTHLLPDDADPGPIDHDKRAESQTIVVGVNRIAYVKLLPSDAMKEFEQFRSRVDRAIEGFSLAAGGSRYVPPSAIAAFFRVIKQLQSEHKLLLRRYINRVDPIRNHLRQNLIADVTRIWSSVAPVQNVSPLENVILDMRAITEERRNELRKDPSLHLPFNLVLTHHAQANNPLAPDHPGWRILSTNPDRALIDAFISLLLSQVQAVYDLAESKQMAAVQRQLADVKLLISVKGKSINLLLKQLHSASRPGELKSSVVVAANRGKVKAGRPKKDALLSILAGVRSAAKKHSDWLRDVRGKDLNAALDDLFDEYEL